jgi:hypothetical protein
MNAKTWIIISLAALLLFSGVARTSNGYNLSWYTLDAGGGTSSGGSYVMDGTIGQPDVGLGLSGGSYRLDGGFWSAVLGYIILLPLVMR